jgi:hypothetical protein
MKYKLIMNELAINKESWMNICMNELHLSYESDVRDIWMS